MTTTNAMIWSTYYTSIKHITCTTDIPIEYSVKGSIGCVVGAKYETMALLGSTLWIGNLVAVTKGNYLCNELGRDTISTGGSIACAMEMYEKGYLTKEDTGGIEFKFGDDSLTLHKICRQKPFYSRCSA